MTVGELIEKLKQYDPSIKAFYHDSEYGDEPIVCIESDKLGASIGDAKKGDKIVVVC